MNPRYGWVMVALGAFMSCIAIGAMFSLAVFLQPITQATGWSHVEVSGAMTIGFLAMACTSMIWGTLSDRFGPRPVVLTGSIVLAASLALASPRLAASTTEPVSTTGSGPSRSDRVPQIMLLQAMARNPIVMALDTPVTDQPVSRAIGCRNTGNENMPPIETQPSRPPAATITQR